MTGSATAEADEDDFALGVVIVALVIFTILADVAFGAFIFKVWNERQQTHEYHGIRVAVERVAAVEERVHPLAPSARVVVPSFRCDNVDGCLPLPTLGGTAVEP